MRLDGERRLSRCLPITITFVPNHHSQCLYCVFPIMRCTFCSHLDVGLAERRTPCRFVGNLFLSSFLGKMAVVEETESLKATSPDYFLWVQSRFTLLQPCTAFSTTSHLMESAYPFFFCWIFCLSTIILRLLREVGDFWLWAVVRCLGNCSCSQKFMRYILVKGSSERCI